MLGWRVRADDSDSSDDEEIFSIVTEPYVTPLDAPCDNYIENVALLYMQIKSSSFGKLMRNQM